MAVEAVVGLRSIRADIPGGQGEVQDGMDAADTGGSPLRVRGRDAPRFTDQRQGSGGAAGQSSNLDIHNPYAGITDPLALVAPFDRKCQPGQTDVNVASATTIGSALSISSRPTLDRIVAGRPWLKATDLVSVPGVPPSALPLLQKRGCATPLRLPEPAPLACSRGSAAIDLQWASVTDISVRLGIPRTTATALVANRPLPQNLYQLVAPRTPGLAASKIERWLSAGAACVTPYPFTYQDRTWRWASGEHGAVIAAADNSDYALIVPSGAVQGNTGVWGTVAYDPNADLPSASLHLYGAFSGEVAVRLPDPSNGVAAVLHDTAPGNPSVSWGSSIGYEPGGTIVAALRSLSDVAAIDRGALCTGDPLGVLDFDGGSLLCAGDSPIDIPLLNLVGDRGTYVARYLAAHPAPGPCHDPDLRTRSLGGFPAGMACGVEANGATATWTFTNNTGAQVFAGLGTSYGSVIQEHAIGSSTFTRRDPEVGDSRGRIGAPFARGLATHGFIVSDVGVRIEKPAGSGPSTFSHVGVGLSEFGGIWAAQNIIDLGELVLGAAQSTRNFAGMAGSRPRSLIKGSTGKPGSPALRTSSRTP